MNWTPGIDSQLDNLDGVDTFHWVVHHLFDLLGTFKGDHCLHLPC